MDAIARFIVRRSKVILALTALTTLTSLLMFFRLGFNADITSFLGEATPEGRAFMELQRKYGAGDPVTAMVERRDGGAMTERQGLELVIAVRDELKRVEGVRAVGSLVPDTNPMTGEPFDRAALDALQDGMLPYLTDTPLAQLTLSEDKRAVLVMVDPGDSPVTVGRAVKRATFPPDALVTFAGNPVVFAAVLDDLGWFLLAIPPLVIFLLLLVFAANIGSRKLAALSIVPAALGSVWTFGVIFGFGYEVDLVTVIVPIWVIVMGSADGLHFTTHLQEAAARTSDREEQTASALRAVGLPMILTTVSTAAGFLSMLTTDVRPMQQLGVFSAIGITFAGLISFFFLPALLSRVDIGPPHAHAVGSRLTGLFERAARGRTAAVVLFLVLAGFSAVFVPRLEVNTDQLFFFGKDHPVRTSFEKLSKAFGGATPMFGEFAFDRTKPMEPQFERLRTIARDFEKLPGIRKVFSVADVEAQLPEAARERVLSGDGKTPMGRMVSEDGVRFVVLPREITAEGLDAWTTFAKATPEIRALTGQPVLFDAMSRLVMRAQASSLGLALLLVGLMLLAAYRRIGATLLALVPMLVTIAVLLGFYAASGIQLHLLTAIVSSIVIGVGIDYVIHLFAAIELQRPAGPGYVLRAIRAVGRPILANALGIAIGLSGLMLSPLRPHTHISLVMWVAMVVGAVTTLVFVPALSPRDAVRE